MLSPVLVLLSSAPAPAAAPRAGLADSCYHYTPSVVSLTGRLLQRTMPGPPHYESLRRGDRPEVVDFLILDAPICTIGDYKDSPNTDAFPRQDTLQIRREDATWREVRRLTGHHVTVTGTLVEWALGRDRTPVVIDPTAVRPTP